MTALSAPAAVHDQVCALWPKDGQFYAAKVTAEREKESEREVKASCSCAYARVRLRSGSSPRRGMVVWRRRRRARREVRHVYVLSCYTVNLCVKYFQVSFLRGYPLPRGSPEPDLGPTLGDSRVGAASTKPPPFL